MYVVWKFCTTLLPVWQPAHGMGGRSVLNWEGVPTASDFQISTKCSLYHTCFTLLAFPCHTKACIVLKCVSIGLDSPVLAITLVGHWNFFWVFEVFLHVAFFFKCFKMINIYFKILYLFTPAWPLFQWLLQVSLVHLFLDNESSGDREALMLLF